MVRNRHLFHSYYIQSMHTFRMNNMQGILKVFCIFLMVLSIHACSSDEDSAIESPFFSFLSLPDIRIDTIENASAVWEYGFRFSSLKAGTITRLGIKVPTTGSYKVRLYDLANNQLLIEKEVQSSEKNAEHFVSISEIKIGSGADMGLSLVADVFFKAQNLSGAEFPFPQDKGNLRIISFNEEKCGPNGCATFPATINKTVIAPCVNLEFKADN